MNKIYASYNNIVSSLGFDTQTNAENVKHEVSGIQQHTNTDLLPIPFYSSLIESSKLDNAFAEIGNVSNYTRLEKMMLLSLNDVIKQSNVEITERTGLIISTTKGNVDALDKNSSFSKERAYLAELGKQIQAFFGFKNEAVVVSNACVSGVLAVAIAKRFIQTGIYDNVLIASGDIVTQFILSGFNSFQAISDSLCKPFSKNRTGINIGEAAASILVTKDESLLSNDAVKIVGGGSCNDANHISGPSRTGEGLVLSIESALSEANIPAKDIDYISAHGTATNYNDEMEAIAMNRVGLQDTPINSLKGYYGHTLGASGLVETIIGMQSLHQNKLFTSLGFDELGVTQKINVIDAVTDKELKVFLKTASGFGGCNTAVLFEKVN